jgi:hypothetical protein
MFITQRSRCVDSADVRQNEHSITFASLNTLEYQLPFFSAFSTYGVLISYQSAGIICFGTVSLECYALLTGGRPCSKWSSRIRAARHRVWTNNTCRNALSQSSDQHRLGCIHLVKINSRHAEENTTHLLPTCCKLKRR